MSITSTFEPMPTPPGIRYYKATGRRRIKGEWLVVRTVEEGLTTWDYLAPMTVERINYPKGRLGFQPAPFSAYGLSPEALRGIAQIIEMESDE